MNTVGHAHSTRTPGRMGETQGRSDNHAEMQRIVAEASDWLCRFERRRRIPSTPRSKALVYPCWTFGGLLFPLNRACFRQVRARIWQNLENGAFQPTQMKLVDFAPP